MINFMEALSTESSITSKADMAANRLKFSPLMSSSFRSSVYKLQVENHQDAAILIIFSAGGVEYE